LLENLKEPELRARYRTRRELRGHPAEEVLPAVKAWAAKQNDTHAKLEALWVTWGANQVDEALLREMLASSDFHARAAAVRVLRYNTHRIADHVACSKKPPPMTKAACASKPSSPRVGCQTFLPAKNIVAIASKLPLDDWSKAAAKPPPIASPASSKSCVLNTPPCRPPAHLSAVAKAQFTAGQEVYFREGHCVTCHQPNGKGLDPAFPSIVNSPWVTSDRDRLIKIAMYGLMGPIKVGDKEYNGQVPMTPFGGMLKDEEIANVLTFVRNHFGNKADPSRPPKSKPSAMPSKGRMMLYTTDELLKEHPMK
jgi:mono/diheme cytochrome c family protein